MECKVCNNLLRFKWQIEPLDGDDKWFCYKCGCLLTEEEVQSVLELEQQIIYKIGGVINGDL